MVVEVELDGQMVVVGDIKCFGVDGRGTHEEDQR
jgi:hypothetical protein